MIKKGIAILEFWNVGEFGSHKNAYDIAFLREMMVKHSEVALLEARMGIYSQ